MAEASFETLFGSCVLEVIAPDTSVSFPEDVSADEWLASPKESKMGREQAFFDEQLRLFLTMQIDYPSPSEPDAYRFPQHLVDFLSHIQVSLEATYISHKPERDPETQQIPVLSPPRTSSGPKGRPTSLHPSIFPPSTPNPIPSSTEGDRKYLQSEGILLLSSIWGASKPSGQDQERFALLFSEAQGVWIAVYEFSLVVSYLRLPFSDPLLCLTASATLRDQSLSLSQTNHPLVVFLSEKGVIPSQDPDATPEPGVSDEGEEDDTTGLEEVNLLDGLSIGLDPSSDSEPLYMPSTRLGNATRKQLFSLPPVSSRSEAPASTSKRPHHILRKSYRKVLQTVSGFRVRMRTVFVPHVLIPKDQPFEGSGFFEGMNEEWEAGNNEQTVVLCVEVENSGESGPDVGFSLERVGVKVGGDGATSRLIGWGDTAFAPDVEQHLFPLLIGSMEQFNLLYIVSFLNVSNDKDDILLTGPAMNDIRDLQRAVTITIYGRPYSMNTKDGSDSMSYPTGTFSSVWNCILDLSSKPREEPPDFHEPFGAPRSALPEPPSPLPGHGALASFLSPPSTPKPPPPAIAGKRHTLPANVTAMRAINPSANTRFSMPPRDQSTSSPMPPSQIVFTPQSASMQASGRPSPTTFGVPPQMPGVVGGFNPNVHEYQTRAYTTPPTPSYPAFSPAPNTPYAQALGSQQGYPDPSVEIRRERGAGVMSAIPQTPLPTVYGTNSDPQQLSHTSGEPVIVSVGLLPIESDDASESFERRKIYPSGKFTLDIFVYNRSSWTRRFEVSCPDVDRKRRGKVEQNLAAGQGRKAAFEELKAAIEPPGILPMQNRVRVGPLRPSTCQSVRMDFIALLPGVHSVDVLTLTDIETGYSVNLRSVTDIVVHERDEERENPAGSKTMLAPSQTSYTAVE
ncbi:TRAPP trafficking subunit Trs65-domain-containing protein [Phlebopus sp. FC_14]|nr:TRAPP trafficking subunit Trs65-domain-containing protein [Phlebopus sp. FC_14]